MHKLLKRQLKKVGFNDTQLEDELLQKFISIVNDAYEDTDDNREFLEHILVTSSNERQELYEELQEQSELALEQSICA